MPIRNELAVAAILDRAKFVSEDLVLAGYSCEECESSSFTTEVCDDLDRYDIKIQLICDDCSMIKQINGIDELTKLIQKCNSRGVKETVSTSTPRERIDKLRGRLCLDAHESVISAELAVREEETSFFPTFYVKAKVVIRDKVKCLMTVIDDGITQEQYDRLISEAIDRDIAITPKEEQIYKPLKVKRLKIAGIVESLIAMRLPKGGEQKTVDRMDLHPDDVKLGKALVKAGDDHAKFTRGILVWVKLEMQAGWMLEFETYRHGVECLSTSSSMHMELKDLSGAALAAQKQKDLVGKVYTRIVTMSYQALRSMFIARRHHRHPDWQIFCDFVEELPYFNMFIMPDKKENRCE